MGQARRGLAWALLSTLAGCATIPQGQYGVSNIDWVGVDEMSDEAIEACLVTRERERVVFRLGMGAGKCGDPPFDSSPPRVSLWRMPWNEWPVYDPAIFDLDKERILRWYRARGFYDAKVKGVRTYVDDEMVSEPIECDHDKSSCKLEVMVEVDEGKPVLVKEVKVETTSGALSTDVLRGVEKRLTVVGDKRFDEHDYEQDKQEIQTYLWNQSYARAKVKGKVEIDREKRVARVTYLLEPGPACVFGELKVEGNPDDIPADLVILAADLRPGKEYSHEAILDAEQAIFALGVFSSVAIKPQGEEGSKVDLVADVRVGRLVRWSGGIGIMSGTQLRQSEESSVPQWDVHLVGAWEHRNFLGGMRRLRLEERPRMIFQDEFPGVKGGPRPGNIISLRFEQPQTFERRTTLFFQASHDFGPDPYEGFFRHDLTTKLGLSRPFWRQRFKASLAIANDVYVITDDDPPSTASSYELPYLEQQLTLDLRNNPQRPRYGFYASVLVHEAFRIADYGSWDYVRILPDVRGYVPLMWGFVLAGRFALGALFIADRRDDLDRDSSRLGPWPYRLRGGGANSNRGFEAGKLGVPDDPDAKSIGGIRRFEGSLELRIPFGEDFGMVLFGDVGNVSQEASFHFEQLNTSVGFGLRYFTIIGAVRLDLGWRVPGWQTVGDEPEPEFEHNAWPSAFHLTIGEAF
ncbi:MAG TPA: BamA/TamA family outer membrane protein [Polyangiales bacterium]|nr:BamA/TamA family outer membrane protein [Polyangiales bacterium]